MLGGKELHLPQHTATIMLLTCSGTAITKEGLSFEVLWFIFIFCDLPSHTLWCTQTSPSTPLNERSATAGGKIIREARNLKKEPARPTHPPPTTTFFKKSSKPVCNQRPQKTCQGHFRIENTPLLFITLNSVPVLKCCFLSC